MTTSIFLIAFTILVLFSIYALKWALKEIRKSIKELNEIENQ